MDDLKLYGKVEAEVQSLTNTVGIFSTGLSMEFGLEKCITLAIKKGEVTERDGLEKPYNKI